MSLPVNINWNDPAIHRSASAGLLHLNMSAAQIARRTGGGLCYLASPYSKRVIDEAGDWDPVRSEFAAGVAAVSAALMAVQGVTAVSPIVLADAMVRGFGAENIDPLDDQFWSRWCAPLLQASKAVIVAPLSGWAESLGVWREVRSALAANKRVYILGVPD